MRRLSGAHVPSLSADCEQVSCRGSARDFGVTAHVIVADLARPDAPRQLVDALPVDVDVLVNNAGFGVTGPFVRTDLAKELEMIQVNVVALTHLTKLLLPPMIARR